MADDRLSPLRDRLSGLAFSTLIGALGFLPYAQRVALTGQLVSRVVAPIAGWDRRIRANLALVCPDLPAPEVDRLVRAVPDNAGRSVAEMFSGTEFVTRCRDLPLTGPGAAELERLQAEGKGAVLVTGHFGNYDVWRGGLVARGFRIGALYRPMRNSAFNKLYVTAIETVAAPLFPKDKRGMAQMMRYLREGGMIGLAIDQDIGSGTDLTFFGKPARTALSAADIALRHNVPMIPIFATRQPDGLSFVIEVEAPVPTNTPEAMSQEFNDRLERRVRAHMDQWFWIHKRWKTIQRKTPR